MSHSGWIGRSRRRLALAVLAASVTMLGGASTRAQQPDVDRQLEEAKALYREARFAQAIARLQLVVAHLERVEGETSRTSRADAHLHLALSYVALNEPAAARDALRDMLRADAARRLDPDVYAPKVIALLEEARAALAREASQRPAAAPSPTSVPSPQPASAASGASPRKKGGGKIPLILAGVGAATVGGIALAAGGDGGSVPVADDVNLVTVEPPSGSTVSFSQTPRILVVLRASKAGPERGLVHAELVGRCVLGGTYSEPFDPGISVPVRMTLNLRTGGTSCERQSLPLRFNALRVVLLHAKDFGFHDQRALATRSFPVSYELVE